MRTQLRSRIGGLAGVLSLALAGAALAQGVPEPGVILYGKVWSGGELVTSGELVWTYASTDGKSTVQVTTALQAIAASSGDTFSYRALLPAASPVTGYPLGGNVLPATATAVEYARSAILDGVPVTLPAGAGTDTFSLAERGTIERLDLSKDGSEIPTYAISGTVAYGGRQPGDIVVEAFDNGEFSGTPVGVVVLPEGGAASYALSGLLSGAYSVRAFRDQDGDAHAGATEAWGQFGANPVTVPPDATGVAIVLTDVDADDDGLPDWWETSELGDTASTAGDDDDEDGAPNGLEYSRGTDPDDPESAPGPVAWWPLDEGSGALAQDATGSGHDGTLDNGPGWAPGLQGSALRFDGDDDRVTVPSSADLDLSESLTLQAWIWREGPWSDDGRVICRHDGALETGYGLSVSASDGTLELLSDSYGAASTGVIPFGRWVHVAATFDAAAGSVRLYLDGRLDSTHPHAEPCTANDIDLRLGGAASGGRHFAGLIDEPKVYAYARSAAAIAADAFAITGFAINGGAAVTREQAVTLENTCAGNPTELMASERADFAGAAWEPYATAPGFTLSAGDGLKTLYLRVRGADGERGPVSDSILLDRTAPGVTDVDAASPDGVYGPGSAIEILVVFSEPVWVSGAPRLSLETGAVAGQAEYEGGSGSPTLHFRYTVADGDSSPDLDCSGTEALALNGGSIADAAGNDAALALPVPGSAHSLGANRDLVVGTVWTVSFTAGAHGSLFGPTSQLVPDGSAATPVTAQAEPGYVFQRWTAGGLEYSLANPLTVLDVTGDLSLVAVFREALPVEPSGVFALTLPAAAFSGGAALWDLSGPYATAMREDAVSLLLAVDSKGKAVQTGQYQTDLKGKAAYSVPLTGKGAVKGKAGTVTATVALKGAATGIPGDAAARVKVSLKGPLTLNAGAKTLAGTLAVSTAFGAEKDAFAAPVVLALPAGSDGTYSLTLSLSSSGTAVTGTGTLRLSSGAAYPLLVKGKVAAGVATLAIAGDKATPTASGIKLSVRVEPLEDGSARVLSLGGAAFGQRFSWTR